MTYETRMPFSGHPFVRRIPSLQLVSDRNLLSFSLELLCLHWSKNALCCGLPYLHGEMSCPTTEHKEKKLFLLKPWPHFSCSASLFFIQISPSCLQSPECISLSLFTKSLFNHTTKRLVASLKRQSWAGDNDREETYWAEIRSGSSNQTAWKVKRSRRLVESPVVPAWKWDWKFFCTRMFPYLNSETAGTPIRQHMGPMHKSYIREK